MLALLHMDKTHRSGNDACRMAFALAHEAAQLEEGGGGIAKGEEHSPALWKVIEGETHACLSTSDIGSLGHVGSPRVVDVCSYPDAETLNSPFSDAACHHGDIRHDGVNLSFTDFGEEVGSGLTIHPQQMFHVEVGRSVNGMEQGPQPPEWHVRLSELSSYGLERLYHDGLAKVFAFAIFRSIVAARSDEAVLPLVRLAVADDDDGEHVHVVGVEIGQSGELHLLLLPTRLTHIAYRRIALPMTEEEFLEPVQLPIASVASRVVDGCDEVCHGSCLYALLYLPPLCHEVAHADYAEVVAHGSAEQCGSLLEGTDARHYFYLHIAAELTLHLVDERCHAIDASIATGDDTDVLALVCMVKGLLSSFALTLHACVDAEGGRLDIGGDKLQIVFVPYDHVALLKGCNGGRSDVG